jgi:pre-mRNA 3'-end-processing factor FIP1
VAETPLEDGGVEEEDEEEAEEDSDDDEDDVKLVFSGQAGRALDLRWVSLLYQKGCLASFADQHRKPQQQPSNVIGIGKWAHTSTGQAAPASQQATPTKCASTSRPLLPPAFLCP